MTLTAYFDESGTHGSTLTTMSGFLGDDRQWRKFGKRVSKLFKKYKVNIFHMVDLKHSKKEFDNWSIDKKIKFIDEFTHITNETLECGFTSIIKEEDYQKYYASRDRPKKVIKDSKYGILFRGCITTRTRTMMRA